MMVFGCLALRILPLTLWFTETNSRPAKRNDIRRLWSKAVVTLDTSEKDEAVAKLRKEQEARIRSEADLANSRMAYEMLKIQMTNLQKKHDRQRSLKLKYG